MTRIDQVLPDQKMRFLQAYIKLLAYGRSPSHRYLDDEWPSLPYPLQSKFPLRRLVEFTIAMLAREVLEVFRPRYKAHFQLKSSLV